MGDKNLWAKLGLIVLLVGMCLAQVYPFDTKKLKPGIDLGGGHSLTFEIDTSGPAGNDPDLAQKVMNILKQRVDPAGQRNLVWRPIGRNRLEIQMPGGNKDQQRLRKEFDDARNALQATNITEGAVRYALALPPEQRAKEFERMSKVVTSRKAMFEKLVTADEKYNRLNAEYAVAKKPATTQATTQPTTTQATTQPEGPSPKEIDAAFVERNETIGQIVDTNVNAGVVVDLLNLGKKDAVRQERLTELHDLNKDNTSLLQLIDHLTATHAEWSKEKRPLEDPADLIRLLRGAGVLEFRILAERDGDVIDSSNPDYDGETIKKYTDQLAKYGPRPRSGDHFSWFKIVEKEGREWNSPKNIIEEYAGAKYILAHSQSDMGLLHERPATWVLRIAQQTRDRAGRLAVQFRLDSRGGLKFGDLTERNINRPLCIFLDNQAISSANINSRIFENGIITGTFSEQDVRYLVNTLNAGTLIASLKPVPLQQKSVGPTLGKTNREKGQFAVKIALIITIIFMVCYYAYCGVIADIALMMNLVLTLGVMSFIQATFTLPGIAGLILMLGMAVDANVLIYERIREELQRGVSVNMAVRLGYEKAFSAILDSNVTTIITAVILASLGSEEIKGFGLTLGIGLCTSLFTALFVTRRYFNIMVPLMLNGDEVKRTWGSATVLALFCGAALGMGWLLNHGNPEGMEESTWMGLGMFLLWLVGTAAVLLVTFWLFRFVYYGTGQQKAGKLPMVRLFSAPNINWMNKYRICWTISGIVIVAGLIFDAGVDREEFLDIEFLGGTKVEIQLKPEFAGTTDEDIVKQITSGDLTDVSTAAGWLHSAAAKLESAKITKLADNRFEIVAGDLTPSQLEAFLMPEVEDFIERGGMIATDNRLSVQFDLDRMRALVELDKKLPDDQKTQKVIEAAPGLVHDLVEKSTAYVREAADKRLASNPRVQVVGASEEEAKAGPRFEIITTEPSRALVAEALLAAMGDKLVVKSAIKAKLVEDVEGSQDGAIPINQEDMVLSDVIGGQASQPLATESEDYKGGVVLIFDGLDPAQTAQALHKRLRDMRFQPDFEEISGRDFMVVGLEGVDGANPETAGTLLTKVAIVVGAPENPYWKDKAKWQAEVAGKEIAVAKEAFASASALQSATRFDAQVAFEATQKAIIAIILSLLAIAGYLWLRFGSAEFGLAGIIALFHDVAITLSCLMACHYISDTAIGRLLMLQDFRVDMALIAAFMTIVGYSINDTIVIFDRVRENRGRLSTVSPGLVNKSVNETLSRTIITSLTTFMAVMVMYIAGGDGIHGFAFALIIGVISGTYSTIAIATPMILHPRVMWTVSIIIGALAAAGITATVPVDWLRHSFLVVIAIVALYGLFRQWVAPRLATA